MSKASRSRRRKKGLLPPPEQCLAHTRTGDRCKNPPILGSVVCRMHGGSAPQVRAKAAERFAMEQDRAASAEIQMAHDPEVPAAIRLSALKDILDRGGTVRSQQVEITLAPWEQDIEGLLIDSPDVVDAELVEDAPQLASPTDEDRLPSLMDDPPAHQRPGPRLR